MAMDLIRKLFDIFTTPTNKFLNYHQKTINLINQYEEEFDKLSLEEIKGKREIFKEMRVKGEDINNILPQAFALVRAASKKVLSLRHFDVQLMGGIALYEGKIAEMKTGEGKTLAVTCAVYLDSLDYKNIHVVTANDYLAKRDGTYLKALYESLGLTVGYITEDSSFEDKKKAYRSNVTYCSTHQVVFDWLKDNLAMSAEEEVQEERNVVYIDEVDQIINNATVPHIISGEGFESIELYQTLNPIIEELVEDLDYKVEERTSNVNLTDGGAAKVENEISKRGLVSGSIYEDKNIHIYHYIRNLLKAHKGMKRDKDYVVVNGEIIIVDPLTGRRARNRRFSNGLHQALEAKEKVEIKQDSKMQAVVSYPNYFRLYKKIAGMSGTAISDSEEFDDVYNLKVIQIPTNKPCIRIDRPMAVYRYKKDCYEDLLSVIIERHKISQPILVGTPSVYESERISEMLVKNNISHSVLNAKNHEKEAEIIAQAGKAGSVTVATSMAGRGTDIKLGGDSEEEIRIRFKNNPKLKVTNEFKREIEEKIQLDKELVKKVGGLLVLIVGTPEESKIEVQFQGRSGRQGDPGESMRFFSLEDDTLSPFLKDYINLITIEVKYSGKKKIINGEMEKYVRRAQDGYQALQMEIRKNLSRYDDIIETQRSAIYSYRRNLIREEDMNSYMLQIFDYFFEGEKYKINIKDKNDLKVLSSNLSQILDKEITGSTEESILNNSKEIFVNSMKNLSNLSLKRISLKSLDKLWSQQLEEFENLKQKASLASYSQKDPVQEYRHLTWALFIEMMDEYLVKIVESVIKGNEESSIFNDGMWSLFRNGDIESMLKNKEIDSTIRELEKTMSNNTNKSNFFNSYVSGLLESIPCPCNSGKAFKDCHFDSLKDELEGLKEKED